MPNTIIDDSCVLILSTYQFEWVKSLDGGIEELKRAAKLHGLYIQDYGKQRHKVIVNEKGELELL